MSPAILLQNAETLLGEMTNTPQGRQVSLVK